MAIIQAYQCPQTGRLYTLDKKDLYVKHLKKLARKNLNDALYLKRKAKLTAFFKNMRETVGNISELQEFIVANSDMFLFNAWVQEGCREGNSIEEFNLKLTKFKIQSCVWIKNCRNTHSSPIGKPKNWGGKPDLPTGYSAWHGRLQLEYSGCYPGFFSNIFKDTGIYFGSGSGGKEYYASEFILWEDDWPLLSQQRLLNILKG